MKCSKIEMNAKAMNEYYNGFEIRFYDMEQNEGMETKEYKTFGRADKAARKFARIGNYCSLVGWFVNGFGGITYEEIAAC